MNGMLYCDVLQQELTQTNGKNYRTNPRTRSNKIWRPGIRQNSSKKKMAKLKLNALECPAKSSHLNLIEMLWPILDEKLAAKPIYLIMELRQRLEEEWNGISQLSCLDLIDSMPDSIQKCLKSKGAHFM